VAVLAEWEKRTGRLIADHFDLIAGTSTGGIIAFGLGLGLPADEILRF
jgi:patatin-like phospholipase/acyl hydrolase